MNRIRVFFFFLSSRLSTSFYLSYFAIITFIHLLNLCADFVCAFIGAAPMHLCLSAVYPMGERHVRNKLWDLINDERRCHRNVVVEMNYILYHGVKITRVKNPVTSLPPTPGPQELPVPHPQKRGK